MGSFPLTKFGIVPFDGPLPATLLINHHVHHKYENTNTINIVIINCLYAKASVECGIIFSMDLDPQYL